MLLTTHVSFKHKGDFVHFKVSFNSFLKFYLFIIFLLKCCEINMFVTFLQFKYFINRLNTLKLFNRWIKKMGRVMDVEADR